jgi:Tfp pilus assembly protein PilF
MSKTRSPRASKRSGLSDDAVRRLVSEGARFLAEKRPGEALTPLTKALDLEPDHVAATINLGGAYILQGKHDRAVPVLEKAARLDPENAIVWSNLAAAYLGKLPFSTRERQDRAVEAYEHALALDPSAPHVHYNLGLIYLERKDIGQATAHFHAALQTDPNDRDARYWLDKLQHGEQPEPPVQMP